MKQGSFRAVRLAVFLFIMLNLMVFSIFGDESTIDYLAIVLENFTGETAHSWTYGGKVYNYEFEWALDASKFASRVHDQTFPQLTTVSAWPMALFGATNKNNLDLKSLGIWGRFDRRGYNWIDIYPAIPGTGSDIEPPEAFEIPVPGRIHYLDMWVWGSNLNYYMEVYFRDYQGVVHSLYMGSLAYQGWKNLRVQIPTSIRQTKRILPRHAGLTLVKFRLWTTPLERVDNFYVYFNQVKVLTDTFESLFDGNDLADPEYIQEIWAKN
jgi:hypothetical protein